MLPVLDILQSVPVLSFLSITVMGFIALFPGSLLGVECASIFAIFTAQAWNMTFGFYHSLVTIPPELQEAASVYRLNRWQRFGKLELPASAIGLMWNSMMSFGGGWFFVAQSEAITVLGKNRQAAWLGFLHGYGGRARRYAGGGLRHRGHGGDHRRHRPVTLAPAGGVGGEV